MSVIFPPRCVGRRDEVAGDSSFFLERASRQRALKLPLLYLYFLLVVVVFPLSFYSLFFDAPPL